MFASLSSRKLSLLSLILIALAGCSGESNPTTYPVTGTVTYKGQPVPNASVILSPKAGVSETAKGAAGKTDAEGKFSLTTFTAGDGALPGTYEVAVTAYPAEAEEAAPADASGDYVELSDEEGMYDGGTDAPPPPKNLLPQKYAMPATSGLEHTVAAEPSTLTLDLQ
jgi:hypothetical protein